MFPYPIKQGATPMLEQNHGYTTQNSPLYVNKTFNIVDREQMSGLSSMCVEGEERNLGIVKNFKDNSELKRHLPDDFSISWAHLDAGEQLATHRHPVASLIIAIEGAGLSQGDSELTFKAGDALVIPPWYEHGFTGFTEGLWALSIQFNEVAIFENEIDPLTTFDKGQGTIPELSERLISLVPRTKTTSPLTFKSHNKLNQILPSDINFRWLEVTSLANLPAPTANSKRLIIACSGSGKLASHDNTQVNPDSAFWQQDKPISLTTDGDSPFWVLLLEVSQSGMLS